MIKQYNISKYTSTGFEFDIKRWKSLLKHIENELIFVNRQLKLEDFSNRTLTLVERLNSFKRQIKVKAEVLKDFDIEITEYEHMLANILEYETIVTDNRWLEQHNSLKNRFEIFCKDFSTFRLKVLQYTGGVS